MGKFQALFEAYGGNYGETMERFLKNEALYLRIFDLLPQDGNLARLGAALEAGDLEAAFQAAHTLKGVVGNLGLTPLYREVCALVEPLRAGEAREDYGERYRAIQREFQRADRLRADLKGANL